LWGYMPKMNYSKTEESFHEGMRKWEIGRLFELTEKNIEARKNRKNKILLKKLTHQIKSLDRRKVKAYRTFQTDLEEIKRWQGLNTLSEKDLQAVTRLQEKIDKLTEEAKNQTPLSAEEKAVEKERVSQSNKRFNVQGHWLPL